MQVLVFALFFSIPCFIGFSRIEIWIKYSAEFEFRCAAGRVRHGLGVCTGKWLQHTYCMRYVLLHTFSIQEISFELPGTSDGRHTRLSWAHKRKAPFFSMSRFHSNIRMETAAVAWNMDGLRVARVYARAGAQITASMDVNGVVGRSFGRLFHCFNRRRQCEWCADCVRRRRRFVYQNTIYISMKALD